MYKILNLNKKRVCDVSTDKRTATITIKGSPVIISVNKDGTLDFKNAIIMKIA